MDVAVIGGHGQIGLRLLGLLAGRGDRARGVIRDPAQTADLEAAGAEAIVCDLERDPSDALAAAISGADAVVFAAGAGPGSGPERKRTVDFGGAEKLIEACREAGVSRYVMVSAMVPGRDPSSLSEAMRPYYEAKVAADEALRASGLDFTIVRPGGLTNDRGTGSIEAAAAVDRRGKIARDDVAATVLACLDADATIGKTFDVLSGDTPIAEAIEALS